MQRLLYYSPQCSCVLRYRVSWSGTLNWPRKEQQALRRLTINLCTVEGWRIQGPHNPFTLHLCLATGPAANKHTQAQASHPLLHCYSYRTGVLHIKVLALCGSGWVFARARGCNRCKTAQFCCESFSPSRSISWHPLKVFAAGDFVFCWATYFEKKNETCFPEPTLKYSKKSCFDINTAGLESRRCWFRLIRHHRWIFVMFLWKLANFHEHNIAPWVPAWKKVPPSPLSSH